MSVVQAGVGETHHDDGDGQQDPVEQSRIPVDGLHHGLGHDGRHVGEMLVSSRAWMRDSPSFMSQPLRRSMWSSGHASS